MRSSSSSLGVKSTIDLICFFPRVNRRLDPRFTIIKFGQIPAENLEDALHIALATVNGMDFLLTWNFNHINNAIIKRKIIKIAENNDYECPEICSPEELEGESL